MQNDESRNFVFISHSSKDIDFVLILNDFIHNLGIPKENIFCSSIEGQGVKHGQRIEDTVKRNLSNSTIILYVLSQSFLESQACMQELGVGWMNNAYKHCFYVKLDDITMDEIKGFLNTSYKFTLITEESLSEFIDDFCATANLPNIKASETLKLIKSLVSKSSNFIEKIIDEKKLTDEEKNQKILERLHESVKKLNVGEKKALASLYFAEDQCGLFELNSGVINLLEDKRFVYRLTQLSSWGMFFQYTLQPWIKEYIDENSDFKDELAKYNEGPSVSPYTY